MNHITPLKITLITVFLCIMPSMALAALPAPDYVTPPDNPSAQPGWDTFAPDVSGSPTGPSIGANIKQADPDSTITISGADFTSDTYLQFFGQTNAGNATLVSDTTQSKNIKRNGNDLAAVIPANMPTNSAYLIWPTNSVGTGKPQMINKTEATWLNCDSTGTSKCIIGDTVHVFGKNLSNGSGSAWLYLQPASGAGQWLTTTAVDDYEVQFVLPTLANGTYKIWAHNGHGGMYGWSNPVTLNVTTLISMGINYDHLVVNLSSYAGGNPDTGLDASAAFAAALTAIGNNGPATIALQAGTYLISQPISLVAGNSRNVLLQGAGKDVTIIKPFGAYAGDSISGNGNNSQIKDLKVDWTGRGGGKTSIPRITNCNLIIPGEQILSVFLMTNSNLTGPGIFIHNQTLRIDHSNFYGASLQNRISDQLIATWGGNNISITNSTGQHLNPNTTGNYNDKVHGRFFVAAMNWGSVSNVYVAHNQTFDLFNPQPDYGDGEQILIGDGVPGDHSSLALAATNNTVTIDSSSYLWVGDVAVITAGRGIGQYAFVTAQSAGLLTLDRNWQVIPDNTSRINVVRTAVNVVINDNHLVGRNTGGDSQGVQFFAGGFNNVIANNTYDRMNFCESYWGIGRGLDHGTTEAPFSFNLIKNNVCTNSNYGVRIADTGASVGETATYLGNIFRNDTYSGLTNSALYFFWVELLDINVWEHSTITNSPKGINATSGRPANNIILYSDAFSLGNATLASSVGIFNQYNINFIFAGTTTFTGYQTLPVIVLPDTTAPSVPTGLTATATSLTQINLSWTASTDAIGVTGYKIFKNGTQIATSTTTSYQNTGLLAGTTYGYTISAYDAAGNNSAQTASINGTTQADTTPPTISTIISSNISTTGALISWVTDENSTSQIDYGPTTSYGTSTTLDATLVTNHSQTLTGLTPNTLYHYKVKSKDAANNLQTSADTTFTTTNAVVAPTVFIITSSAGSNGSVTPLGNVSVTGGGNQTFTIIPNIGYNIDSVLVDGTSMGAITTYTFSNVAATHTINASFTAIPVVTQPTTPVTNPIPSYTPTENPNPNPTSNSYGFTLNLTAESGSVNRNPYRIFYAAGESVTLTAVGRAGYMFSNWSGSLTGSTNPAVITMDSDKYVFANFIPGIAPTPPVPIAPPTTQPPAPVVQPQTPSTTANPNVLLPVPPATPAPFNQNLSVTNYQPDVQRLQQFLNTNGYPITSTGYGSPGYETNYYGPGTATALRRFQQQHLTQIGITSATGVLDAPTRTYINSLTGVSGTNPGTTPTTPVIPTTPATGSSGFTYQPTAPFNQNLQVTNYQPDVQRLQRFLNNNGYPVAPTSFGSIGYETNYYGPGTATALRRFQQQHLTQIGISAPTGVLDAPTRTYLNSLVNATPSTSTADRATLIATIKDQIAVLQQQLSEIIAQCVVNRTAECN